MTRLLRAITERSIVVQLGLLVVACQVLAHALTVLITVSRTEGPDPVRFTSIPVIRAGAIAELIQGTSLEEHNVVIGLIQRSPGLGLTLVDASAGDIDTLVFMDSARALRQVFPSIASQIGVMAGQGGMILPAMNAPNLLVRIDGTRALSAPTAVESGRLPIESLVVRLTLLLVIVPLALGTLWALLSVTAPLRRFAQTADRFAINLDQTPLPVAGSSEMRTLAHAFNTMRDRIRDLVDSRARMLAAVSHDLRTPLTRIRLRAEAQPDSDERTRTLRDIGLMDEMIGQSLSFLRDQASVAMPEAVDLATLAASVCDDFADTGGAVTFSGPRQVIVTAEPDLITRALSNVVDNALKYGSKAQVTLEPTSASEVALIVADDGPGIPDGDKALAFEPFGRGDRARGQEEMPGFGLGLAIARQIVERHGGRITLHDVKPHGLAVRIALPVGPPRKGSRNEDARRKVDEGQTVVVDNHS